MNTLSVAMELVSFSAINYLLQSNIINVNNMDLLSPCVREQISIDNQIITFGLSKMLIW